MTPLPPCLTHSCLVFTPNFTPTQVREGDWYPSGLSPSDMRGLAGYKIFLSVSLLLGEGAFIMAKAALLGECRVHSSLH
jgi:hypothetical protein